MADSQSFGIFLDSEDNEPEATLALAKLGAQAFIVPGLHFSVTKMIHPDDVYDLQMRSIDWMFKKITTLVKQQEKKDTNAAKMRVQKQRARVLTYFRPLSLLLGPVTGRDALRIREHLERVVDDSGGATHVRASTAYRAYEKRLVAIAGKDSGLKTATQKVASKPLSKSREVIEDSDEEEEEVAEEAAAINSGHAEEESVGSQHDDEEEVPDEPEATEEPSEREADDAVEEEEEREDDPMDEDDIDATPTKASQGDKATTPTPKRRRDDSSLPDLDLAPGDISDDEIDLAFDDLPEDERERSRSRSRSRSLSIEPTAKRRKTTKRY